MIIEIALGIVLGVALLRVLPQILAAATLLVAAGIFVLLAALVIGLAVWQWERVLFFIAMLAAFAIGGPLLRVVEARARFTIDELFLLGLCACGALIAGSAVGMGLIGGIAEQTWRYGLSVAIGAGFASLMLLVIHLIARRAARRNAIWSAPVPSDAKVIGDESEAQTYMIKGGPR